ncbi:MAG: hypothetical protein ABIR11_02030 [Candidatus Limnocylindrales bacterium]
MTTKDLGLAAVETAFREMAIDKEWSVGESRGFTWWGAWVRQRVWADKAVRSHGETLWHVRARAAAYRDLPDEPATYAFVNGLNEAPATSAYAYDPGDGTVSSRCGVFTYDAVHGWLERFLRLSIALQASVAWLQVPAQANGRPLDDAPHPTSGPRKDPDDMLNLAGAFTGMPSLFTPAVLQAAATQLATEGAAIDFDEELGLLQAQLPVSADAALSWSLEPVEHGFLGHGVAARLFIQSPSGPVRAAWISNALNLAEAADWTGEDRPHALGAWYGAPAYLCHTAFFPAAMFGPGDEGDAQVAITNLLAWATMRARFAFERMFWLVSAARSRFPDDEPSDEDADDSAPAGAAASEPEAVVPVAERSFGPGSRAPRPRPGPGTLPVPHSREIVVDPADPGAFDEIDDAVATSEDGDWIVVRPGTYRRPVVVDRAVHIVGDGPRGAIRLEPVGGEALGVAASGASIEGLTIRPAAARNDGDVWSAVAVHDVSVTIEGCDLATHLGATVWVGGAASRAVILGCTLGSGNQNAVWVTEEGRAEVAACRVTGHRWPPSVRTQIS